MTPQEISNLQAAVELAIKHIIKEGCDDIFKPPTFSESIEHQLIKYHHAEFKKIATKECMAFIKSGDLTVKKIGQIQETLVIKDEFTFRKASWIDPFDLVKFLACALLIFPEIEAARIPIEKNVVHSHRRSNDNTAIFDSEFGYKSFRKRSGELTRENRGKWKVITDLASFFDRIGNHPLENHLLNVKCNPHYVKIIKEILFFWAGDRRSFGVPVGSDASRILSEAILTNVDNEMVKGNSIYIRYVDDIRIICESRSHAHEEIRRLTELLADEGLSLNSKKTKIYQIGEIDEESRHEPEQTHDFSHQPIDTEAVQEIPILMRVSGRSSISKFYRYPGKEALAELKKIDKDNLISSIKGSEENTVEELIKKSVKYFIHIDPDVSILEALLSRKLTSIFYIVDAIAKEHKRFTPELKKKIAQVCLERVDYKASAYPFKVPLLRLCAIDGFENSAILTYILDNHKISDNILFMREAIVLSGHLLERARLRSLASQQFRSVPALVQRAIFDLIVRTKNLTQEEKRPLIKNMLRATDDWFIAKMG